MHGHIREDRNRPHGTLVPVLTGFLLFAPVRPFAASLGAQYIRGTVIEAVGRAPIRGATIFLHSDRGVERTRATSDSLGFFVLSAARAGLYTVRATHLSYLRHPGDTLRLGDAESVSIEIRLDPRVIPLQPMVVVARNSGLPDGFEARRATGFGRFLTRKDIDARGASQTTDLLRAMPGLVMQANRRGAGSQLMMRGMSGLCAPSMFIDGIFVAQSPGMSVDEMLPPSGLLAVEVYNSVANAPIQYRTGTCGVVLFWTRRGTGAEGDRIRWWKIALGAGAAVALILLMRK